MTIPAKNNKFLPVVVIAGMLLSAFLFKSLLDFADQGNLVLVVLTAVLISVVAFGIMKIVKLSGFNGL